MLSACKAAPIAVQYSEFFGIIKRTSYIFSITGKRSSHCGNKLRLPMSTKSRISLFKELKIVAEPIDCHTRPIKPKAISSRLALACALAKRDAVASIGKPGSGLVEMSLI